MRISLHLTGSTPLMVHNVALADPDNPYVRQIAAITSKRSKTPEDRAEIARLEWLGGLYVDDGVAVMPTANVRRALERAGALRRLGAAVVRGVIPYTVSVPIDHNGPREVAKLVELPEYRDTRPVGVQRAKTVRTRPVFRDWSLSMEAELLEDVLDFDDLAAVAELAGRVEGLGDARKLGYGRFEREADKLW